MHLATIDWQHGKWAGAKGKYSRKHLGHLVGGAKLKASDSPAMLPKAFTDRAVLASAYMLSWPVRYIKSACERCGAWNAGRKLTIPDFQTLTFGEVPGSAILRRPDGITRFRESVSRFRFATFG